MSDDPIIVRARELARAAGAEWCLRTYFAEDVEEEADETFHEFIEAAQREATQRPVANEDLT